MMLILYPHALSSFPIEAAVIHFPNPEITHPVTKISFIILISKNKKRKKTKQNAW
jgi:hypothetical protein